MPIGCWFRTPPEGLPPDQSRAVLNGIAFLRAKIPEIRQDVENAVAKQTPVRSGLMQAKVRSWGLREFIGGGFGFFYGWRKMDFTTFYPLFVLGGTGIYGPKRRFIKPRTSPVMVWFDEGSSFVARRTRGQKKQDVLGKAQPEIQKIVMKEVQVAMLAGMRSVKGSKGRRG